MVGPLALALEAGDDGVVSEGFFTEAGFCQSWVADHQVAGDESHFDRLLPLLVELGAGTFRFRGVPIFAFATVLFCPSEGFLFFRSVEDSAIHPADELGHVDTFDAHAEVGFKEVGIDDRPGNAHGGSSHGEVGAIAHSGDGETGLAEAENFFGDVGGYFQVTSFLDIATVDAEGR